MLSIKAKMLELGSAWYHATQVASACLNMPFSLGKLLWH